MDEIENRTTGVWRSVRTEPDARKCHLNMTNRLPLLSRNTDYVECCSEWKYITGHKTGQIDEQGRKVKSGVCLCGMTISDEYHFLNDVTKSICVMGGVCCKRLNDVAYNNYIESLKQKGVCWLCQTKHKDLSTHFNSKNHKIRLDSHMERFKKELSTLMCKVLTKLKKQEELRKDYEAKIKTHNKCCETGCNSFISKDEPEWKIRCIECYKQMTKKIAIRK